MIFVYTTRMNNTARLIKRVSEKIDPRPTFIELPWSTTRENTALERALDYAYDSGEDIILVSPSYQRYSNSKLGLRYVPMSVERFLERNGGAFACRIQGVVATGNRTFGREFCLGGVELSELLGVPLITKVDMAGSELDDERIIAFADALNNPSPSSEPA